MKRRHLFAYAVGVALACGFLTGNALAEGTMDPIPGEPRAANFELPDPGGQLHQLSEYRDQVVLVNFWATWCAPCREEMPAMDRLYRELGPEDLEILAVHVGRSSPAMEQFLTEIPVSFPVLIDADLSLGGGWGVVGLPTTVLVDMKGHKRFRAVGPRDWDSPAMITFLRGLLKKGAQ